jgi:hypothetical protein
MNLFSKIFSQRSLRLCGGEKFTAETQRAQRSNLPGFFAPNFNGGL